MIKYRKSLSKNNFNTMKTSHWVIVALVVLAGAGLIFWISKNNGSDVKSETNSESKTESTSTDSADSKPQEEMATAKDKADGSCTRSVNKTLMQESIDIKNKVVTLNVEGYGDIKVELYDKDAPKTVENFLRLSKSGYYDCLTFHRIAKGFVIQGGDPTGTGTGGQSAFGEDFEDELDPNTPSAKEGYKHGVLAMANRGPNTNSSQFFIMLADNQLPHNYTIFGKVVSGLDVVDKIGAVPITPQMGPTDGTPKEKVVISKAVISDK